MHSIIRFYEIVRFLVVSTDYDIICVCVCVCVLYWYIAKCSCYVQYRPMELPMLGLACVWVPKWVVSLVDTVCVMVGVCDGVYVYYYVVYVRPYVYYYGAQARVCV
jgi:hypothetical protein